MNRKSVIIPFLILLLAGSICSADDWSRARKFDLFFISRLMQGDQTSVADVSYDLDDTWLYGAGFGFNIIDHVNLNLDFLYGAGDITESDGETTEFDAEIYAVDLNLDLYLLSYRITPMVTGGIGALGFEGDIKDESIGGGSLTYNAGIGIRWDVLDNLMLKAIYGPVWVDPPDAEDTLRLDSLSLSLGFIF